MLTSLDKHLRAKDDREQIEKYLKDHNSPPNIIPTLQHIFKELMDRIELRMSGYYYAKLVLKVTLEMKIMILWKKFCKNMKLRFEIILE